MKAKESKECVKRSKKAKQACVRSPKQRRQGTPKKKRHLLPPAKVKDAHVLEKKGEWKQKSQRSVQSEARKRSKPAQEAPKRGGKVPPPKKNVTCYHLPRWRMPACLKKKGRMKAKASKECAKRSKKAKQACARSPKKRRQGTLKKKPSPATTCQGEGCPRAWKKRENESKSVKGVCKAKQESEASLRKKPQKEEAGYPPQKNVTCYHLPRWRIPACLKKRGEWKQKESKECAKRSKKAKQACIRSPKKRRQGTLKKRHLLPPAKVKDARVLEKRENESKRVKGVCKAKQESEASLRKKPQKEEAGYPPKKTSPATTCQGQGCPRAWKKGEWKQKNKKKCVKRSKKAKQACVRSPKKRRQGTPKRKSPATTCQGEGYRRAWKKRENESKSVKGVCKAKQESEASLHKKPQKEEAGYPKKNTTCYHLPRWRMPTCLKKKENESKRVKGVCKAKQESEASLRKKPQKEEAGYPKKTPPATTCQGEGCPRAWKKGEWKQKLYILFWRDMRSNFLICITSQAGFGTMAKNGSDQPWKPQSQEIWFDYFTYECLWAIIVPRCYSDVGGCIWPLTSTQAGVSWGPRLEV